MTAREPARPEPAPNVLRCAGELDMDTAGELAERADRARRAGVGPLVLDVREVTFADSSALNTLLRLRLDGPLALRGPLPDQLRRLLEMTGTADLFDRADEPTPEPPADPARPQSPTRAA
ncbi:STAS domain-containing protein (plasmid) [Streptomyces sp. BI20]|uniref:STAS domain-containing protein n=1 Tax=Streptomyces sp. BI20 TaxID=3403460 RepID=UPI003C70749A